MKISFLIPILFISLGLKAQQTPPPPLPPDHSNSRDTVGIFDKVEFEARFPGGDSAWRKYLEKNFKAIDVSDDIWNELSKKQKKKSILEFTAIVRFIVCKDGTVCEVKTINNVPSALKKEAERLIIESKQWEPAQQNNRKVKAYRMQPITLRMEQE